MGNQPSELKDEDHHLAGPIKSYVMDKKKFVKLAEELEIIVMEDLIMGDHIRSGYFGCVYKASLRVADNTSIDVAAKTIKMLTYADVEDFLKEAKIMKDFKDRHVLNLIGVSFNPIDQRPFIVTPFMEKGDLLTYIGDDENTPTVKELITFGIEIAKGMQYLASQKFVHRYLAARNCMLDNNLHVRIGEFGLSRHVNELGYYMSEESEALPIKWMAPESIEKSVYNQKTDVWAFGVTMWELMTRGVVPYSEVDGWDIMTYLTKGRRLLRPESCPETFFELISNCWHVDPAERPTFSDLVDDVQDVITALEREGESRKVGLHITYINVVE